ncbi:DUF2939 domain-containing protein [Thermus sediminis]|uniref:DUF2939 domain-containing protein n=1 Tax=Thermus sediminis TaxID=1761908 RepID=UPI000E3C00F7|nr:DUF2939 domain-containing protein [Thermus sediminis]
MKARLILAGILVVALGAGYLVVSPFLTLRNLVAAVERQDAQALERYVDFPRVREGLKADLNAKILQDLRQQQDPFAALGTLLAAGLVNALVDALLTPEGLAALGTGQEPGEVPLEEVRNWRLRLQGLDRAFIHHKDEPNAGLVLERQGLRWRVVAMKLGLN